jgi:hypothetical protein
LPRVGARGRFILHGDVDDGDVGWRRAAGGLAAYVEAEWADTGEVDSEADDAVFEAAAREVEADLLADALESDED